MKRFLPLTFLIALFTSGVSAQTQTLVSGTLVDPNGIAYYPTSVTACLSPATLNPTVGGRAVNPNPGANYCVGPTTTSVTGFFSLALWPNANISPAATTWVFSVAASGSGPPAGNGPLNFQSAGVTISGATQDVSANINSVGTAQLKAGGGGISSGAVSPLSFGAKWDVKFSGNCSWTGAASTTNVICAGGDITFTAADVGKLCFGTSGLTQVNQSMATAAGLTLSACTISAFTSATQVTVTYTGSSTTCTPSSTIACSFAYGTQDDTTAIQSAQTAAFVSAGAKCILELPAGAAFVSKSLFNVQQTNQCMGSSPNSGVLADVTSNGPVVRGQGPGVTVLIPLPSFDFTTCNTGTNSKSCFGTIQNLFVRDLSINGLQQVLGGTQNVVLWESGGGTGGGICDGGTTVRDVTFSTWGLTAATSIGFQFGAQSCNDAMIQNVNVSAFGATPCSVIPAGGVLSAYNWLCFGGTDYILNFAPASSGIFNSNGSQYTSEFTTAKAVIHCGAGGTATMNSTRDLIAPGANSSPLAATNLLLCNGASMNVTMDSDQLVMPSTTTSADQAFFLNGSSVIHMRNSTLTGAGTNNRYIFMGATDKFYNDGGNSITLGSLASTIPAGTYISSNVVNGACTGVGTAASTLGLFGTGPNVTLTTCTSTTIGSGQVMQGAGNLQNLVVSASAAGVNASSGVVTVLKNGAGTTITCTVGTGTVCNDTTHTVAFVAGDLISIQFTTQTADTLAGVKASVDLNL